MRFTTIVSKSAFKTEFGDNGDWTKWNFPFKCYYSEVEIPEKVFEYSATEPCYPFGQCMLQSWGFGIDDPYLDIFNGLTSWKCASFVDDDPLTLIPGTLGWVTNFADTSWKCLLEGYNVIEDIENNH